MNSYSVESVFLNGGKHEDFAICCVYGFQEECIRKYDEVVFAMFVELFQYLPLFTVINSSVLVVHGKYKKIIITLYL